jgi:hypothetical protein
LKNGYPVRAAACRPTNNVAILVLKTQVFLIIKETEEKDSVKK